MSSPNVSFAARQVLLMLLAVLFIGAIMVPNLQLPQYEPADTAQCILMFCSVWQWTLWELLIALALAVSAAGYLTLLSGWNDDPKAARQRLTALQTKMSKAGRRCGFVDDWSRPCDCRRARIRELAALYPAIQWGK